MTHDNFINFNSNSFSIFTKPILELVLHFYSRKLLINLNKNAITASTLFSVCYSQFDYKKIVVSIFSQTINILDDYLYMKGKRSIETFYHKFYKKKINIVSSIFQDFKCKFSYHLFMKGKFMQDFQRKFTLQMSSAWSGSGSAGSPREDDRHVQFDGDKSAPVVDTLDDASDERRTQRNR